jgi:hypothetical protein
MRLFRILPLLALLSGCKTPTEVVVRLDTVGGSPDLITVKLHRSVPYSANATGPGFVESVLDGADLDLLVTPQGPETVLSLIPTKGGPNDITLSASAPGFSVDPPDPLSGTFEDGVSKTLTFTLTALPPDAGVHDMAKAVVDAAKSNSD